MNKADKIFKDNIREIMENGVYSEKARPKYKDGTEAYSKYITQVCNKYDLTKGEFPITTLRRIAIKKAINELFWIYRDQTNSLNILEETELNGEKLFRFRCQNHGHHQSVWLPYWSAQRVELPVLPLNHEWMLKDWVVSKRAS